MRFLGAKKQTKSKQKANKMEISNDNKSLQITAPNSLINAKELEFANKVNDILVHTQQISLQSNPIIKGLMQSNAMMQISELLTPDLMKPVEKLAGSPMGFKTDKVYPPDIIKRIFIEATLGGWGIVGNQINVLGGNMYVTKNGYLPRLRKIEGLKFTYPFKHGLPVRTESGGWTITTQMEYEYRGEKCKETLTYPVIRNDGQSSDAVLGKADTKMCRWLWQKITGEETNDDAGNFVEPESVVSGKAGEGEKVNNAQVKKEERKEGGEFITEMISNEYQTLFNTYISKAASKEDLIKRAKAWCDTPNAKSVGVTYTLVGDKFESPNIDLTVFTEVMKKFL